MQNNLRAINDREEQHPLSLLPAWEAFMIEEEKSPGTRKQYLFAIRHFISWYEEEERAALTLRDLTPIAIRGYRNELQLEQQKSFQTINMRLSALRAWCAWLMEAGYITADPSARVKLISGEAANKREGLTSTQVNALLRQAAASRERDKDRNTAIIQVLLQTGIRLSECSALTFGDITFGERSGTLEVRAGKGNKARSVPLNSSAREALAVLVASRLGAATEKVKAVAAKWPRPGSTLAAQPVFLSQKGGALTTSAMGQMIAELVKEAGELVPEETTAHTLRHTFAHNYLDEYPGDIVGLAALLGHSSLDTTRLYSEPTTTQLSKRVEQMKLNAYGE
jgi:site-specific recombinase XerD